MKNKALLSCARAALAALCALCALPDLASAQQSARRKLYNRVAPSPSLKLLSESAPEVDFDFYVGRVVRKDGEYVVVNIVSHNKIAGRPPIYYGCDIEMCPTSILSGTGISHKACASFKIESGEARVGDVVMVKYPAPERSGN